MRQKQILCIWGRELLKTRHVFIYGRWDIPVGTVKWPFLWHITHSYTKGSGLLGRHCAAGWLVLHMSKDGVAFTFNSKQSKMTYCPWRWRQCNPLTCQKPVIQWHSNTFYKTCMVCDNIKSCIHMQRCIVNGYYCCVVDRHFFLQDCHMYCT
jgi:hypothetical protein